MWDASKDFYIQEEGHFTQGTEEEETQNIQSMERRVYEFLPVPMLNKSLTKAKTKKIMIAVNKKAY